MWRALAVGCLIATIAAALLMVLAVEVEPQTSNGFQVIKCMPSDEMKEKVRQLMLDGLDSAFKQHVENTVLVWFRDDRDQPHRAAVGIRNGIRGYVNTRDFILNWNPPKC